MQSNRSPRKHTNQRRLSERLQTSYLLTIAIIGLVIGLVSLFPQIFAIIATIFPPMRFINLTALILLVFSSMAIAISLERREALDEVREETQRRHEETLQKIEDSHQELAEVHQTLTTAVPVKPLIGHDAVYEEATRLIKHCRGSETIRSTSVGLDEHPDMVAYRNYLETLAKKIGEGKRHKLGMVHKVVMGFHLNENGEPPLQDQPSVRNRRELFRQNNVLDRLEIKCLENFWSLNLLLVDNEHIIIGFPTRAKDRGTRFGIRISNKAIVESVIRWYDEYLWREAVPVHWTGEETRQ